MTDVELTVIGGIGLGVVLGWLLPVVKRVTWKSVAASAGGVVIVAATILFLAGLSATLGGLLGTATGAWLHAAFVEHLAARTAEPREA